MVIYPDIQPTPDSPTIKFNQPREQIDLEKELPRILHAPGWGCGTLFSVMFLSHDKTKLLAYGRFVVSEEIETIQTNDANPYQPMTRTVFSRSAAQIGDWWMAEYHIEKMVEAVTKPSPEVIAVEDLPIFMEEPKRRGRPPNQPKAD